MPTLTPDLILQVRHLRFAYPAHAPLLSDWSADLPAGITLLEGDSGSGKSTLLRLLAGELRGSGELTLAGQRIDTDVAAWQRQVCWIDPRDVAWNEMTPGGLMTAQRLRHPGLDESAWKSHLYGFDLVPHLSKPLYALSTGTRRKAALAVALSAGATLTLLDEPTAGLDQASVAWLAQTLTAMARQPQRAWLLASAYGLENALPLAGRITL